MPISMTAVTGDFIAEAGISDIHQLARFTPNVHFATNPCCPIIFIRGFGTPFTASSFDPTVGIAIDELSISQSVYFADPLFDVERLEVLRGPQGTLFGKNTTGGLFNLTTVAPTKELAGTVLARVGGLGVHRVEAGVGGPIGPLDWAQFRLSLVDLQDPGDVENTKLGVDVPSSEQTAGRLKIAVQPTDDLDVLVIGSLARTEARAFQFQQYRLRDSSVQFLRQFDPEFDNDGLDHRNSTNTDVIDNRDTQLIQTNLRYSPADIGPLMKPEVVAILGWTKFDGSAPIDFDFSPADIAYFLTPAPVDYTQRSAELRFGGTVAAPFGLGTLELLTGGLFLESTFFTDIPVVAGQDFGAFVLSAPGFELATGVEAPGGVGFEDLAAASAALGIPLPPTPALFAGDGARVVSDQETKSQSAFGQIAWHLTERWTLTAGGRYTHERKTAHLTNDCFDPGVVCIALGAQEYDLDLERTESDFSPRFTAQYRPFDDMMLFASRSQGFKSGGFNNFSITGRGVEVEPEKVVSWETGAKGRLFDGTVSYAATFFNMDAEDLQVQNFVGTAIEVRNAASARSRGVEAEFQWLTPFEPLSIFGAGSFTDAKFKDYQSGPAPRGSGASSQDLSGERMPFVSKWQFNVTPTLRVPFRVPWWQQRLAFMIAFYVFYRSDQFLDLDLDPNTRQGAFTIVNGRIGFSTLDEKLAIGVAVGNLTDTDALEYAIDSTFFPGGYMAFQEPKRNVTADVRYRF